MNPPEGLQVTYPASGDIYTLTYTTDLQAGLLGALADTIVSLTLTNVPAPIAGVLTVLAAKISGPNGIAYLRGVVLPPGTTAITVQWLNNVQMTYQLGYVALGPTLAGVLQQTNGTQGTPLTYTPSLSPTTITDPDTPSADSSGADAIGGAPAGNVAP